MDRKYITQDQLADLLGLSPRSLERWRVSGTGPAFVKAGRKPLYDIVDVDAWLSASRRKSTSEVVAG